MGKFTTKADEYVPPSSDDVWIKGLKQGDNRVRILQPTGTFESYREHYAEGPGFFMCDKTPKCPGCTDPSEKTQKKTRKYAFNALEQNGRLSVFKIGSKLFEQLKTREQRNGGTLMDRDWVLVRSGSGLQTEYFPEAGEKYEVEWPEKIYDVENAVARKYFEACEAFGITPNIEGDASEVWTAPFAMNTKVTVTPAETTEEDLKPTTEAPGTTEVTADDDNPENWPTVSIKAYLDEHKIDYIAKASRGLLVKLAKEQMDQPPF